MRILHFTYKKDGRSTQFIDQDVEVPDYPISEEYASERHAVTSHPVHVRYLEGVVPPIPPLSQWPIIPTGDYTLMMHNQNKRKKA